MRNLLACLCEPVLTNSVERWFPDFGFDPDPENWFSDFLPQCRPDVGRRFKVDVYEEGDKWIVEGGLPGVKKEDINLDIKNGILTISAESKREKDEKGKNYAVRELSYKKLSRSVQIPDDTDQNNPDAELKNGVLTVKFTKLPSATVKKIEVK